MNDTFFRFNEEKEELLIPKWLFDETKLIVMNYLLHSEMRYLVSVLLVNYRTNFYQLQGQI